MSIDRHQNKESGIPDSSPFHKKYVAIRKKVFGSTPFSKGVAGCRAGPCKEGWIAGQELCEERRGLGGEDYGKNVF